MDSECEDISNEAKLQKQRFGLLNKDTCTVWAELTE